LLEILLKEWTEEVKRYIYLIANFSIKESQVGAVLDDVLNISGKMIRAKILLLSAFSGTNWKNNKERICKLAAMVELTHLASLIHDDIVDDSPYRRGKQSIQGKYGKDAAVFAGDFLIARVFYYGVVENLNEAVSILAKTIENMCIGEIEQELYHYQEDISEEKYFEIIERKTAALFQAACSIGARESVCSKELTQKLELFVRNLGLMFQIKDDILDFTSNSKDLGKETHKDFQNGIYTFPVIMALKNFKSKEVLEPIMKKNKKEKLSAEEIIQLEKYITSFGGIEASYKKIEALSKANRQLIKELGKNLEITFYLEKMLGELEEKR
jgi:heptaprenyl diphosphate synthase component II